MARSRLLILVLVVLAVAIHAAAHPMGNFSVNHYSALTVNSQSVQLRYLIDMAEIPTFQELQAANMKADVLDPGLAAYLESKAQEFSRGLTLRVDGVAVPISCVHPEAIFPPGAGGLPTMKLGFSCSAKLPTLGPRLHTLAFTDNNFPGRAGWKEIIVNADSALKLSSNVPSSDRSNALSNYPTDLLNSPPQVLAAEATFTLPLPSASIVKPEHKASFRLPTAVKGHAEAESAKIAIIKTPSLAANTSSLTANTRGTPKSRFTELMLASRSSWWFLAAAAGIAMGLGSLHALEPGHGKTLVAAYLVGSRGNAWSACVLGVIVTLSHTAGVYVLGAITLYASRYVVPEQLYPVMSALSGAAIVALGLTLLLRHFVAQASVDHKHWFDRFLVRPEKQLSSDTTSRVSTRQLLLLGVTGGIVPCPAALVVLLSAMALHRIAFGFFLILCFSLGLAAVLIGIGLVMVRAGNLLTQFSSADEIIRRKLPIVSAVVITLAGCGLLWQAIKPSLPMLHLPSANTKWLLVAGIGLLLGMRHSTDPDHVIAVTTIVTRLRSLRHASLVGMLWGIGHTLTIFLVGSAIILFGIVIPPRIGLSMEFAVALMLVLLGVLNLTGVLAWINRRLSPSRTGTLVLRGEKDDFPSQFGTYHMVRPLVIGIVHGLAGSAAVALLVLATIHNPVWAVGYLLLFGAGTVVGMMVMTAIIAAPVVWTGATFLNWNRYLSAASGVVSLAFGLFLVYRIGFVAGLFSSAPKWIPE